MIVMVVNGGWAATQARKILNGYATNEPTQAGTIGGEATKLSNANQIKKVKKDYLPSGDIYEELSETPSEDYLWLLSCGEIWSDGDPSYGLEARGLTKTSEGSQYKYYKTKTSGISYNSDNPALVKKANSNVSANNWWLRSPYYNSYHVFCLVSIYGGCVNLTDYNTCGVAPCFSI